MVKITVTGSGRDDRGRVKTRGKAETVSPTGTSFTQELTATLAQAVQGTLQDLMDDLRDQEQRFLDQQNLYEMGRYKALVQKILRLLLDEGTETRTLKRSRRDRADFMVVDIINDRLLEISKAITGGNRAFQLMKTIEEIRGLLLDLSH